jgi:hypothetical protein
VVFVVAAAFVACVVGRSEIFANRLLLHLRRCTAVTARRLVLAHFLHVGIIRRCLGRDPASSFSSYGDMLIVVLASNSIIVKSVKKHVGRSLLKLISNDIRQ